MLVPAQREEVVGALERVEERGIGPVEVRTGGFRARTLRGRERSGWVDCCRRRNSDRSVRREGGVKGPAGGGP